MMKVFSIQIIILLFMAIPAMAYLPRVLVINSYHPDFPWVATHNEALERGLEDAASLSFFNMDTKRIPPHKFQAAADRAMLQLDTIKPAVVVLTDDNALSLLGGRISALNIPVVYLGINANPRDYGVFENQATGVLERPLFKRSIVFIQDILPGGLKKCLVLYDNSPTAHASFSLVFNNQQRLKFAGTETHLRLIGTLKEWQKAVLSAKELGYKAIIVGLYHTIVNDTGQHVPDEEIIRWTSAHSAVPVFGFWDFSIGKGKALGGLVLSAKPQGWAAAKLVKRILAGEKAAAIEPVIAETGRFVFSDYELKRWNLVEPVHLSVPSITIRHVE
nr:ABC transporter substrate binding protein [uncultured Pseudodesulfovibrio sp.]